VRYVTVAITPRHFDTSSNQTPDASTHAIATQTWFPQRRQPTAGIASKSRVTVLIAMPIDIHTVDVTACRFLVRTVDGTAYSQSLIPWKSTSVEFRHKTNADPEESVEIEGENCVVCAFEMFVGGLKVDPSVERA
jgi:hypothetical protein